MKKSFQRIGSSNNVDKRLYKEDISASIVHTQMLVKQKIINHVILKKIGLYCISFPKITIVDSVTSANPSIIFHASYIFYNF